jgi:hypothetical protein
MTSSVFKRVTWKSVAYVAGLVASAAASYWANHLQAVDATAMENAPKYLDYQVNRDGQWSGTSPVDAVTFTYRDQRGQAVDALNRMTVELYDFGPRDLPEFDLQIDATRRDGTLPQLLGDPSVTAGGSEDFPAEHRVQRFVRGNSLSVVISFPGLSQTDELVPDRKIALFFAGKESPILHVSARGKGVHARQEVYQRYNERVRAKEPLLDRYGFKVVSTGYLIVSVAIVIWLLLSARARETRTYRATPEAIEQVLAKRHPGLTHADRIQTAQQVALAIWTNARAMQSPLGRALTVMPRAEMFSRKDSSGYDQS